MSLTPINVGTANTTTDILTTDAVHGLATGDQVQFTGADFHVDLGGGSGGALVDPNTLFYAIVTDTTHLQLASSLFYAVGGDYLDLTNAGTGAGTLAPVSKVMPTGVRSLLVAKASTKLGTPSYGNPSPKIITTALTAGQGIQITFPAMESYADPNSPQSVAGLWLPVGGSDAQALINAQNGPMVLDTDDQLGGGQPSRRNVRAGVSGRRDRIEPTVRHLRQ